jgi:hypothetical protein
MYTPGIAFSFLFLLRLGVPQAILLPRVVDFNILLTDTTPKLRPIADFVTGHVRVYSIYSFSGIRVHVT